MRTSRLDHLLRFLIGVYLASLVTSAYAQRTFSLSLTMTNNQPLVSWNALSATPVGDLVLVPQYQLQRSPDLKHWASLGSLLTGTPHQVLSLVDTNSVAGFYRVQSIISKEYAQMPNAVLTSGQLQSADFFGANLFGVHLDSAFLQNSIFGGADIQNANFTDANLTGADLFNVEAAGATFDGATIQGADASFSDFSGASMFNTDFTDANVSSAVLTGANLDFAVFNGMILDTNTAIDPKPKLIWQIVNQGPTNVSMTNQDLSDAFFENLNFHGVKLNGANVTGDDFTGADLRGANFTNATTAFIILQDSLLDGTTIIDAKSRLVWTILNQPVSGRNLTSSNLSSVFAISGDFINATMTSANCTNSEFFQANFNGAKLNSASFNFSDLTSATLTNANLTSATLRFANLTGANFRNATTNGADFTGATFGNTIMPNGTIRNF